MNLRQITPALMLLVAGCGGGSYTPPATTVDPGPAQPPYYVVNLSTFAVTTTDAAPNLSSDEMAFHWVPGGRRAFSTSDALTGDGMLDATEPRDAPGVAMGIWEVTQAQWTKLAAFRPGDETPWLPLGPYTGLGGNAALDSNKPAFGLQLSLIRNVLVEWNKNGRPRLRLPTALEWEWCSRAGSTARYHWGIDEGTDVVEVYATVRESNSNGPALCGSRQKNAWGFYDMAGNVWEWATNGNEPADLHGGSWNDNYRSVACGNRMPLDEDTPYATAGLRLVLEIAP